MAIADFGPSNEVMGKDILKNFILGSGVGASATGLYYLAKKLRRQFEENIERNRPRGPDYSEVPLEVPALPVPSQKKLAALDINSVGAPLLGSAAGAILAAATSNKKNKRRNALIGAGLGGLAGLGANTKPVHEFLGGTVQHSLLPLLEPIMGEPLIRGGATSEAWRGVTNIGAGAAGVLGGKALYDLAVQPEIDRLEDKKRHESVESARKEYFDALLSSDASGEKRSSSVDQFLDETYAAYTEEKSATGEEENTLFGILTGRPLRRLLAYAPVAATAAGGVLGAKYMYDQTMAASRAKSTAKAIAARERMKSMPPVWIDPKELAQIKQVAREESDQNQGV